MNRNNNGVNELIAQINALVQEGNHPQAIEKFKFIQQSQIPHPLIVEVASLARRAGMPHYSLSLLEPLVRSESGTPKIKAEFACGLARIGAQKEALELLGSIDPKTCPEKFLYEALTLFTRWEYEKAIPVLEAYLKTPSLDSYQRMVGQLNLAIAFVFVNKHEDAAMILKTLIDDSEDSPVVRGSAYLYMAQVHIEREEWVLADEFLTHAHEKLRSLNGLEGYFVEKWMAILALRREGATPKAMTLIHGVRVKGQSHGHWESVRQCDFEEAIATNNQSLFLKALIGTPYQPLRAKMLERFKLEPIPSLYVWEAYQGTDVADPITLDLMRPDDFDSIRKIRVGSILHRLMDTLTSDFYGPFRVASLCEIIFPDEHYNADTSPARIHQAVYLLRKWLAANRIPLAVLEENDGYRITATGPTRVLIHAKHDCDSRERIYLSRLKEQFGDKPFSTSEVSKTLKISTRSAYSIEQYGVSTGMLERTGEGKRTTYRFKSLSAELKSAA